MAGRTDGSSALQDEGPKITMTTGGKSGGDSSSSKSLGYRNIMQSVNDNMRPDFTGQAMTPKDEAPERRRSKIKMNLRDAEGSATDQGSTRELDAQSGENNVSSGFANNVGKGGSINSKGGSKKLENGGGFFKKKGPLVSIIISIVMGGSGMYLSQAALPFTMLDKLNGLFDTTNTSTEMRSKSLMRSMVRNNKTDYPGVTKRNLFGKEKFKPTSRMKRKLGKQGITFSGGEMIYKDKSGATTKMNMEEFKTKLDTDADFRAAYTKGTKTWRTSVAAFKDKLFDKLLGKFGLSKNRFGDYDAESDPDGSKARERMRGDVDDAANMKAKSRQNEEPGVNQVDDGQDPQGNPRSHGEMGGSAGGTEETTDLTSSKNAADVNAKLKSALARTATLTTIGCGFTKAISAISVILSAYQIAQVISTAQAIFEPIDKARTEDANSSPINAVGKSLTTKTSETRTKTKGKFKLNDSGEELEDPEYVEEETAAKSAVQSEGLSSLFTGDPIDMNDEAVLSMNPSASVNKAVTEFIGDAASVLGGPLAGIGYSTAIDFIDSYFDIDIGDTLVGGALQISRKSYLACLQIESTIALVGAVIDAIAIGSAIVGIVGAIFTAGASLSLTAVAGEMEAIWTGVKTLLKSMIKAIAIALAVSIGTQILVTLLKRKLVTEFLGEDLGNAIYSGGSAMMSRNHRAGGGVVASKEGYLASLIYTDQVNLETAKNERLAHSPFDYTSSYTFAGQLASAIIPVTLQSDSILDSIGNFASVVRNSANSFLPGASAATAAEKAEIAAQRTEEHCPELYDIGGVADSFCNPYVTTDFDTIEVSDSDASDADDSDPNSAYNVMKKVADYGGFEDNDIDEQENPEIDLDSNLGKYVTFCGQRESPFGQPDQDVMSKVDMSTGSTIGDAVLGVIPVVGDTLDIIGNTRVTANWGWVEGSNCVMDHEDSGIDGVLRVDYEEIKTYNRYAEDQRLAEAMGVIDKSAVTVAVEKYYEKYPLDNSLEGILARYSGLSKEEVIGRIEAVQFYSWLAQYDPTDMYPTPAVHEEIPNYTMEDKRFVNDDGLLAVMNKGFTDLFRQRNFATA